MEAQHPDEFVLDLFALDTDTVFAATQRIADATKMPPLTVDEVLARLSHYGLIKAAAALRL